MNEPRTIPPTSRTVNALVLSTTEKPPTGLCAVARLRFEVEGTTILLLRNPEDRQPVTDSRDALIHSPILIDSIFSPEIVRVDARVSLTVGDAEERTGIIVLSSVAAFTFAVGGWKGVARDEHLYVVPTRLVSRLTDEDKQIVADVVNKATTGQLRTLTGRPTAPPDDARSAWEARVDLVTPAWLIERLVETEVEQQTPLARPNRGWLRRMMGVSE